MVNTPARVRAVGNMLTVQRLLQTALGAVLTLDESAYIRIIKGLCNTGQCEHVLKVHSHPVPRSSASRYTLCMQVLDEAPPSEPVFRAAIRGCVDKEEVDVVHDQAARDCDCVGMPCADSLEYCRRASKGSEKDVAGGAGTCQAIGARPCQAYNRHVRPMSALKNTVTSPQDCAGTAPRLL